MISSATRSITGASKTLKCTSAVSLRKIWIPENMYTHKSQHVISCYSIMLSCLVAVGIRLHDTNQLCRNLWKVLNSTTCQRCSFKATCHPFIQKWVHLAILVYMTALCICQQYTGDDRVDWSSRSNISDSFDYFLTSLYFLIKSARFVSEHPSYIIYYHLHFYLAFYVNTINMYF